MAQLITYEGQTYSFGDDFTDEERNGILNEDGSWKVRPSFWEWRESENKWVKTNDEFDYNYNK